MEEGSCCRMFETFWDEEVTAFSSQNKFFVRTFVLSPHVFFACVAVYYLAFTTTSL